MHNKPMRRVGEALGALTLAVAFVVAGAAGPGFADKTKDCGTQVVGPGNSGFTQTETQTAACNSNSDTGEEVGPVTNRGGGTPRGQQ